MYCGENPIAIQSQKWLVEALVSLMNEMPYQKISVLNICKKADLSRQTFYNFFETKEDILRFCLRSCYEKLFTDLSAQQIISLKDAVDAFMLVLEENRELLGKMIENGLEGLITEEIARCIDLFANRFSLRGKEDHMLVYGEAFLSGALARVMLCWFQQKEPVSAQELTDMLLLIFQGEYFEIQVSKR